MQLSELLPTINALKASIANSQNILDTLSAKAPGSTERVFFETSGLWSPEPVSDLITMIKNDMAAQQASLDKYEALYQQMQEILAGQSLSV